MKLKYSKAHGVIWSVFWFHGVKFASQQRVGSPEISAPAGAEPAPSWAGDDEAAQTTSGGISQI